MRASGRFLLFLLLVFSAPAYAWGPEGHEIAARIAADNLTPSAHLRISQLLGGDAPALMVLDSNWADEIRGDRPQTAAWHFVNIEIGSKGYDPRRDCGRDNCVVAQIGHDIAVLRNPRAPQPARLEAFRFLIHFVADLHQPLHAADRHDKGGNGFAVMEGRRRSNLHRVWDQDVVEALGPDPMLVAGSIEAGLSPQDRQKLMAGTPADWANESFQVAAREIYARIPAYGPVRLPRDYTSRERATVRQQLLRAGLRLAAILNGIYR
jgi:S1/P1 Nuclease